MISARGNYGRVALRAWLLTGLTIVGWVGGPGASAEGPREAPPVEVLWSPKAPKQGEVLHLWVNAPDGVDLKGGEVLTRSLHFSGPGGHSGRLDALFGVDMAQKPGVYEVRIHLATATGAMVPDSTASIRILPQAFGEERLTLPDSKVHLGKKALARVRKENERMASLWSVDTPERLWEGPFLMPVEGRPGSPFGLRRWINGEPRNSHTGMDIKASEGQPVKAANSGRVALVGDFFFCGNAVFLDHGQGVYTMYFHLSKVNVVGGQKVSKGEVLGLVGMTGRATGPHLHWGVRLGGARVDPASLIDRTQAGL